MILRWDMDKAQERIRELEALVKANYTVSEERGKRISRAREILKKADHNPDRAYVEECIYDAMQVLSGKETELERSQRQALAALEGK